MEETWIQEFGEDEPNPQATEVPSVERYMSLSDGTRAAILFDFDGGAAPVNWDQINRDSLIPGTWAVFIDQDRPESRSLLHIFDQGRRYVQIDHSDIVSVRQVAVEPQLLIVEIRTHSGAIVMSGKPAKIHEALESVGAELSE